LNSLLTGQAIIHHQWGLQYGSQHSHYREFEAATNPRHEGVSHRGSERVFAWERFTLDVESEQMSKYFIRGVIQLMCESHSHKRRETFVCVF